MLRTFIADDCGFIISAELVLVLTIAVLSMVVGLSEVAVAVNTELEDVATAFGSIDQSFMFTGFISFDWCHLKSRFAGSAFNDRQDACDCGENIVTCTDELPRHGHTRG